MSFTTNAGGQLAKLVTIKEIDKMFKILCNTYNLLQDTGELYRKYSLGKSKTGFIICHVIKTAYSN